MTLPAFSQRRVRASKNDEASDKEATYPSDDSLLNDPRDTQSVMSDHSEGTDELGGKLGISEDTLRDALACAEDIDDSSVYMTDGSQNRNAEFVDGDEDLEEDSGSSIDGGLDPQQTLSSISFGALASAQESLGQKRKWDISGPQTRKRLRSISPFHEAEERKAGKKVDHRHVNARSSNHAPAEVSSKKAVSRKRQVVSIPKVEARDPRFSSLSGALDMNRVNKQYAFLNDYRASEIAGLKQQLRDTKDGATKETLRRELKSKEDRERARQRAEEENAVIREHRKEEKGKIKQGKQPFFLKRGEVKKQALVRRFEGMGESKVEKAMEKRRRKKAKKEKKAMPRARRKIE